MFACISRASSLSSRDPGLGPLAGTSDRLPHRLPVVTRHIAIVSAGQSKTKADQQRHMALKKEAQRAFTYSYGRNLALPSMLGVFAGSGGGGVKQWP